MLSKDSTDKTQEFDHTARDILEKLARRFPVCTSSDEFHFFPQVPLHPSQWSRWDDFSAESIAIFRTSCREWHRKLNRLEASLPSRDLRIDLRLLRRMLETLNEQLTLLAVHEKQPTFYLTIMGIGLADAIDAGSGYFEQRLRGLPAFLEQAMKSLRHVPHCAKIPLKKKYCLLSPFLICEVEERACSIKLG